MMRSMDEMVNNDGADHIPSLYAAAIFVYAMLLFPAVMEKSLSCGFDAPIYWNAGRGDTEYRPDGAPGWVYSDRLLPAVSVWARLRYGWALFALHSANAIGLAALVAASLRRRHCQPRLAWACALGVGYFASDTISGGNVSAMLAGAAITPIGAAMVCCVKPWFGLPFLVLHAVARAGGGRV